MLLDYAITETVFEQTCFDFFLTTSVYSKLICLLKELHSTEKGKKPLVFVQV